VVVWYDHKWGYVNVYVDAVLIGSWKPSAGANINSVTRIYGKAGSTSTLVTLNSYYMGIPLVTAIGDSITAGAILHAPNPDHYAGVDNYGNNYPKLISDYLKTEGIKNYFVVNKGVNGETSDQIKARFAADIVATGCKYVFIHGGINDHDTHADTAITTQNKIDMAYSALEASITPTLLGVTPTKTGAPGISHQYSIDLHAAEQTAYTNYNYVDLWTAIQGSTANAADDAKMADTVHPNLTGYTAIAIEIENNLT
jgi:lysophospholipase L1-like esterase